MKLKSTYPLLLIFFFIGFSSCGILDEKKEFKSYLIKKGEHKSHSGLEWFYGKELRFIAKFDHTARYSNIDPLNQEDVNKLYGFSDCGDSHHRNSARFAWRWFNERIEIFAYTYQDSKRISEYVDYVLPDEEHEYKIKINKNHYVFSLKGQHVAIPRGCSREGSKYYLFPFFGGDEKAPHDITVRIKELN